MQTRLFSLSSSLLARSTTRSPKLHQHIRTIHSLPSTPISISPSPAEKQTGKLTPRNLEIATRALHRDGLVVIEDLIPDHHLDKLNQKMIQDAYTLRDMGDDSPYNYNKGNIQQDPPLTPEYWSSAIFTNPLVTHVTSTTLGPHPLLSFISGNTALPASSVSSASSTTLSQPTHTDADFAHPTLPFALVINVPLTTMTPRNGSTEIWLGTHDLGGLEVQEGLHGERASGRIKKDLLEERRAIREPCQPVIKKGSVIVRDLRLWHGGCGNWEGEVRVMLALIHFAPWYRNAMRVEAAEELKGELTLEKTGLDVRADFVSRERVEETYLHRPYGNAYEFDQRDKVEGLF